ncbi:hypothetical protein F5Y00DRAFT_6527 [Daldinia vernicosa]|uniref:uncharacterized protein n=1 Tax=Daldinia vernicosa TaxID=114800 RepID=UPI0020079F3E|nr:uncharacterized protein F5Y00DRAFT_6527 [Daldinia vernicosa]KAI0854412.1 hypothetical protein F5Y00DRAFT_6527 [Daldinia vernicosa]
MRVQLNQISVALVLFGFASAIPPPREYVGCFDSPINLEFSRTNIFNSIGFCWHWCGTNNQPVMAVTNGTGCLCGQAIPPSERTVPDSSCNSVCSGYPQEMCGGQGYFSVYHSVRLDELERGPNQETSTQSIEPADISETLPTASIENQPIPLAGSSDL